MCKNIFFDLLFQMKINKKLRNMLISQHIHEVRLYFVYPALRFCGKERAHRIVESSLCFCPHLSLSGSESGSQFGLWQQLPVEVSVTHLRSE